MKHVSKQRLSDIAREVFDLLEIEDFFVLIEQQTPPDSRMEERLRELMGTRQSYETIELAMYLRASSSRSDSLPTWQPLLNAAIEQGLQRSEAVWDIFYGLVSPQDVSNRNTGQPVYKPHQT